MQLLLTHHNLVDLHGRLLLAQMRALGCERRWRGLVCAIHDIEVGIACCMIYIACIYIMYERNIYLYIACILPIYSIILVYVCSVCNCVYNMYEYNTCI